MTWPSGVSIRHSGCVVANSVSLALAQVRSLAPDRSGRSIEATAQPAFGTPLAAGIG